MKYVLKIIFLLEFLAFFENNNVIAAISDDANTKETDGTLIENEEPDPIEPINRVIFEFNSFLDGVLIDPITIIYSNVVPDKIQHGFRNFMSNVAEPLNCILFAAQGEGYKSFKSAMRFIFNSTFGIFGLVDVVGEMEDSKDTTSTNETLAKLGVGPGFYLVLPILGPSSTRGALGTTFDYILDPFFIASLNNSRSHNKHFQQRNLYFGLYNAKLIDVRAGYIDFIREIKEAKDPYKKTRFYYFQRQNKIGKN